MIKVRHNSLYSDSCWRSVSFARIPVTGAICIGVCNESVNNNMDVFNSGNGRMNGFGAFGPRSGYYGNRKFGNKKLFKKRDNQQDDIPVSCC